MEKIINIILSQMYHLFWDIFFLKGDTWSRMEGVLTKMIFYINLF